MSTPTPAQLEELVAAAGEMHAKLEVLNEIQRKINGYRQLIQDSQTQLDIERPLRQAAVDDVRAASVRFRDALQATDPV